jgi:hypothetical protein
LSQHVDRLTAIAPYRALWAENVDALERRLDEMPDDDLEE